MKNLIRDVFDRAFHLQACRRNVERHNLLQEEWGEFIEANERNDVVGVADALADMIYVAVGTALEYGIPLDKVWAEVQRTNMAKVDPATGKVSRREDGKILKPEGWTPPDVKGALGLE
jgi:predicted HAD superfamily Cof-like phosphohydrolase